MKTRYDLLVVGGGPGGAVAARTAAEKGLSACLVEKRPAIGTPVRCAEGINKEALTRFVKPDPRWISAEINRSELVAPDGTSLMLGPHRSGSNVGFILDRKLFDRCLVEQAADAGAEVMVKTRAVAPVINDGRVNGAILEHDGKKTPVVADVVIAADGVESKFSRWCGINTTVPSTDIMSCAQYLMTGLDIEAHTLVFYGGNEIAPGGYLWVFPKGKRMANVGIGISGKKSWEGHRAKDYLDRFVNSRFPQGKSIELVVGGVPVCRPLSCSVSDALMIVGDAARVVDPFTGGGMYNAMFTGKLAAETAVKAISLGDVSKKALMDYDTGWRNSSFGKHIARNWQIRKYFISLSDEKMNALIQSTAQMDLEHFSTLKLIKEIMKRNPALVAELAAQITQGALKSVLGSERFSTIF
jgi:digeranylgeranylglycerophospholipid reductase